MRDDRGAVLTRHFFGTFFDFGFLTDEGRESFERVLLGAAAVALGIGLLLVRMFAAKYAGLSGGAPEAYLKTVAADHALLIAISMWVAAGAVTLVGHAVFPDETDFRVLMAEPVTRATIFRAKIVALFAFAALFAVSTQAALLPLFVLTLMGPAGTGTVAGWCAAYLISSAAASTFAVLAVVALHGVLLLVVPRAHLLMVAAAVRSALVCLLVLGLLFLMRLPAAGSAFAMRADWLHWAPPAWFVGLERWLLGHLGWAPLALEAASATLVGAAVTVAAYGRLYHRFDRAMLRPAGSYSQADPQAPGSPLSPRGSVRSAIAGFALRTLQRSTLHQGIVVTLAAAAAGFVAIPLLAAWPPSRTGHLWTLLWSPFALMFIAAPAVRLALCVPIELKANWIFRTTERPDARRDVIAAGVGTVFTLGVIAPVAIMIPLQWLALRWQTLALAALELGVGWLLVEFLMRDWRRIPFTCSYIPGKGFVPHMFVKGVGTFLIFTNAGAWLLLMSVLVPASFAVVLLLVSGAALLLRDRRLRHAPSCDLQFEDDVPGEVNPLRLNPD